MFASTIALLPVLGALSASAVLTPRMELFPRQLDSSTVPSACSSTCQSAEQIYNACISDDLSTCLMVCQQNTFSNFVGCLDCVVENTSGVTASEQSQLDSAIQQLQAVCSQAGYTVTGAISGASATASGSGVSTGIIATATSITDFTSAGGITVGGSSFTSAASAAVASASSSNAATTSAAASAASSKASSAAGSGAATASAAASSASTTLKASTASPVHNSKGLIGAGIALMSTAVGMVLVL